MRHQRLETFRHAHHRSWNTYKMRANKGSATLRAPRKLVFKTFISEIKKHNQLHPVR